MEAIKWSHGTMQRQPEGFSDIYWCHVSKGPTVYFKKNDPSICNLCKQRLADDPNLHSFVVHIEGE